MTIFFSKEQNIPSMMRKDSYATFWQWIQDPIYFKDWSSTIYVMIALLFRDENFSFWITSRKGKVARNSGTVLVLQKNLMVKKNILVRSYSSNDLLTGGCANEKMIYKHDLVQCINRIRGWFLHRLVFPTLKVKFSWYWVLNWDECHYLVVASSHLSISLEFGLLLFFAQVV